MKEFVYAPNIFQLRRRKIPSLVLAHVEQIGENCSGRKPSFSMVYVKRETFVINWQHGYPRATLLCTCSLPVRQKFCKIAGFGIAGFHANSTNYFRTVRQKTQLSPIRNLPLFNNSTLNVHHYTKNLWIIFFFSPCELEIIKKSSSIYIKVSREVQFHFRLSNK